MLTTNSGLPDVEHGRARGRNGTRRRSLCVRIVGVADLPTRFGDFRAIAFRNDRDEKEHLAVVHGEIVGASDVLTRIHSECLTGDALGSLRCDCRDQLGVALRRIAEQPCGLLLYLRQEGRGIGLANKIRAYGLQDMGLDTVEANQALGFPDDARDYTIASHMIHSLEVRSVRLMTNNPEKLRQLLRHGVEVAERVPHLIPPNEHNRYYLATKARRSGHWIDGISAACSPGGAPLKLTPPRTAPDTLPS